MLLYKIEIECSPYGKATRHFNVLFWSKRPTHRNVICRPILFEHIADILKDSTNRSILLVERTVVALLRLSIRLTHKVLYSKIYAQV